jgi:hypothetical protein
MRRHLRSEYSRRAGRRSSYLPHSFQERSRRLSQILDKCRHTEIQLVLLVARRLTNGNCCGVPLASEVAGDRLCADRLALGTKPKPTVDPDTQPDPSVGTSTRPQLHEGGYARERSGPSDVACMLHFILIYQLSSLETTPGNSRQS